MKKSIIILFIFININAFGQYLVGNADVINIRESANIDSPIITSLTDYNGQFAYKNEFETGWIKVEVMTEWEYMGGKWIDGWVSSNDIDAPNFKSDILSALSYNEINYLRGDALYSSTQGTILYDSFGDVIVKVNGLIHKLKTSKSDVITTYYNDDIKIQSFNLLKSQGFESSWYQGFLIITYNDLEEVIFVKMHN